MKLSETDHRTMARWVADCAERVVGYFDRKIPSDDRPRLAIESGGNATKAENELKWQIQHLPMHLRPIVFTELESSEINSL